ncbi:MAG: helix-turn-helix domain-containing protein [Acidobacteria bacterium]|nr:helix-turn-helix domain-containing protein [Acidobacteriota bacterium]
MTVKEEGIGSVLRREREARGIGIEELSQATKVRRVFLEAIEAERWEALPARVFVTGYLKAIAQHLGIGPSVLLSAYEASCPAHEAGGLAAKPAASPRKGISLTLVAAGLAGAVVAGAALVIYLNMGSGSASVEPQQSAPAGASHSEEVPSPPLTNETPVVPEKAAAEKAAEPAETVAMGLSLETSGPCWVEVYRGQERLVYRQMKAGERVAFEGSAFRVTVGDASMVRLFYDKKPVALPGKPGTVVKDMKVPESSDGSGKVAANG